MYPGVQGTAETENIKTKMCEGKTQCAWIKYLFALQYEITRVSVNTGTMIYRKLNKKKYYLCF